MVDVYGVSDDLKVFYYDSDSGTTFGAIEASNVDLKNLKATLANADPNMKKKLNEELGNANLDEELTLFQLSSLQSLTLDNTTGITSLSALADVKNLNTLVLKNINLSSLDGLEGCPGLSFLFLNNCKIVDYSNLTTLLNLKYLYVFLPAESFSEYEANLEVSNLSLGLTNADGLKKLEYFGISGYKEYFEGKTGQYLATNYSQSGSSGFANFESSIKSNLSDISSLASVNKTVRNSVKVLSLYNNSFSSVASLSNWDNLETLLLCNNPNLISCKGIENHSKLEGLALHNCNLITLTFKEDSIIKGCNQLPKLNFITLQDNSSLSNLNGLENSTECTSIIANNCNITDISSLSYLSKLDYLDLEGNTNLENVSSLGNCVGLTTLLLENNLQMIDTQVRDALANPSTLIFANLNKYSMPNKYMKYFNGIANNLDYSVDKIGKILTKEDDEWKVLLNRTNVIKLKLNGQTGLTNDDLQTTLGSMTGLGALALEGCTGLTSINFASNLVNLVELDIRGCPLAVNENNKVDLSRINTLTSFNTLIVDQTNIDFSLIQSKINSMSAKGYSKSNYSTSYASCSGLILTGDIPFYSFTGCTTLTKLEAGHGYFDIKTTDTKRILDLTGCTNLNHINLRWIDYGIKLPVSLNYLDLDNTVSPAILDFSKCTANNMLVRIHDESQSWMMSSLDTATKCSITDFEYYGKLDGYSFLSSIPNIKRFSLLIGQNSTYKTFLPDTHITLNNLEYLKLVSNNSLASFTNTSKYSNLVALEILDFTNLNNIANFKNLTSLKSLRINGCKKLKDFSVLSSLSNLEYINLSNNYIDDITFISNLKKLDMKPYNYQSSNSYESRLYKSSSSGVLDLSKNSISDLSPLLDLIVYKNENDTTGSFPIHSLNLANNLIELQPSATVNNVEILSKLYDAGLRTLDLSNNKLKKGEADVLVNKFKDGLTITYVDE